MSLEQKIEELTEEVKRLKAEVVKLQPGAPLAWPYVPVPVYPVYPQPWLPVYPYWYSTGYYGGNAGCAQIPFYDGAVVTYNGGTLDP